MPAKPPSETTYRNATARDKPYRLHDGRGLYLVVEPNGTKYGTRYFVLRYRPLRPDGARGDTCLGLGAYPDETGLEAARAKAAELRAVIKTGGDPRAYIRVAQVRTAKADATTFESVSKAWIEHNRSKWSAHHIERNEGLLRRILNPTLGNLPITSIDRPTMLAPLVKAYNAGQMESARRARAVAGQIFTFAIDSHQCETNPARELAKNTLLDKPKVKHFKAMRAAEVGDFLRKLDESKRTSPVVRAALLVMLMTGLRDAALRGTRWSECDLEAGTLTIPASRQKARKEFVTPLPTQAVAVLSELAKLTRKPNEDGFIFPSPAKKQTRAGSLAENTLRLAVVGLGFDVTAHGFRSLITVVLADADFNREWVERQLDHAPPKDSRDSYLRRHGFLDQRRAMMQWFADWLDSRRDKTEVPPLPAPVVKGQAQLRLVA